MIIALFSAFSTYYTWEFHFPRAHPLQNDLLSAVLDMTDADIALKKCGFKGVVNFYERSEFRNLSYVCFNMTSRQLLALY